MRARLLVIVILVVWAWVVPIAHTMPIDADGPSGLSDNADFDDLIVSLTSPTVIGSSVESRAPPLADLLPNAPANAFPGSARRWGGGDEGAGEQTHDTR